MSEDKTNSPPCREIYKPRSYQVELVEYVTKRNAIIYLPTGAGKTYVAILAIKRLSQNLQKTISNGGKRALFMCNTVELARQSAGELKKKTNLEVGFFVGERGVDDWSKDRWKQEIDTYQVLVGTVQVFVNIVAHNYIRIEDLSIVVFDECHHGTKNHPMHTFMEQFLHVNPAKLPRVIGLTGVLVKGNKLNDVKEQLYALEATYRGNIVTARTMDDFKNVLLYSTKPKEKIVIYKRYLKHQEHTEYLMKQVTRICEEVDHWDLGETPKRLTKGLTRLKESGKKNYIKNMLADFMYQLNDFGLYAASIAILSVIIDFELKKKQSELLALRDLYRTVITKCEACLHYITNILKTNSGGDNAEKLDIMKSFSSPKLMQLFELINLQFNGKDPKEICCLIFVNRRYSAKVLFYVLERYINLMPNLANVIHPNFMIGRSSIVHDIEVSLRRNWTKKVFEEFRRGLCNVLVCSSVLEEGIDVQACNYVIAYDEIKTFSFYVQTKGRARSKDAVYVMFAPEISVTTFGRKIMEYRKVHELLQDYLVTRVIDENDPNEDNVVQQFCNSIPVFRTKSGATLMAATALQLLHRYCQTLPCDIFGSPQPTYIKTSESNFMVKLTLPPQSVVKETFISEALGSAKLCKISASFKACKRLYEVGELNENLLPITKQECVGNVADVFFQRWTKYNDNVMKDKPGRSQRRVYDRRVPEELYECMPTVGQPCYAYKIEFQPHFEHSEYTMHIRRLLESSATYAILLSKKLPYLAPIPLYMDQGELTVKILPDPITLVVNNAEDLAKLRQFHNMIFRDILEIWKSFFVVDNRNKENAYLIVPIEEFAIDWNIIERFPRITSIHKPTVAERQAQTFRVEDYLGRVITKWYSHNESERFIVVDVHENLSPLSNFSNTDYKNFKEFFEMKYGAVIKKVVRADQFLLEVKSFTSRRNFFINAKGKKNLVRKIQERIFLLPELCHNFKYPGTLWMKALFLPTILHRLHFMLHAETLRKHINKFLSIPTNVPYFPKPLQIDLSLRRAVDSDGNARERIEKPVHKLIPLPIQSRDEISEYQAWSRDNPWKGYTAPINLERNPENIFPVEVEYYSNFVTGSIFPTHPDTHEEEWSKSQLSMPEQSLDGVVSDNAITDADYEKLPTIKILDNTFTNNLITGEQSEFLAAITTSGANDMFDMERFELLGDSFLKFSISLYLLNKFPNWHEGFLTEVKSKIVSNRNLLYCMLDLDIPERLCVSLFKPNSEFLPPLLSLPANVLELLKKYEKDDHHSLGFTASELYNIEVTEREIETGVCNDTHRLRIEKGLRYRYEMVQGGVGLDDSTDMNIFIYRETMPDKVVADTLEALLGVCVKNYGIHKSFRMLEFFGICPPDTKISFSNLLDLKLSSHLLSTQISPAEVDGFLINHECLERNLGYKFKNRAYLLQALTHPSYPTNRLTGCYQQLEYIGDAILDFLVSCHIFERFQHMTPGMLTDLRSALVNNITLGCVCVRHRFHLFMLAENAALADVVKNFADYQETQNNQVSRQMHILMEESDIRNPECDAIGKYNISENVEVPKALGDIVEAIIAAVYLDSRNLTTTWSVVYHLLKQEFQQFARRTPIEPVRQLHDHKHANATFSKPVEDSGDVLVKCTFTCLNKSITVNGFGRNGTQAKKAAAKHALRILGNYY